MRLIADYHTHTTYSHGIGNIEDNVKVAISKGLDIIGISDHSYGHMTYGVKKEKIQEMRQEIDNLNKKYKGQIQILLGLECNVLDDKGTLDIDDETLKYVDYILAGYHFGSKPTSFRSLLHHLDNFFFNSKHSMQYNTNAIVNAMKNYNIFAITHPGDKGNVDIEKIARAAKETNTALEINNSHGHLDLEQLKQIKDIGCYFIIGSDAHSQEVVGNFMNALDAIQMAEVDISKIVNIQE